jgi:hypothetical protein
MIATTAPAETVQAETVQAETGQAEAVKEALGVECVALAADQADREEVKADLEEAVADLVVALVVATEAAEEEEVTGVANKTHPPQYMESSLTRREQEDPSITYEPKRTTDTQI